MKTTAVSLHQRKILTCPEVKANEGRPTAVISQDLTRRLLLYWDQIVFLSHNHAEIVLSNDDIFLRSAQALEIVRLKLDWEPLEHFPLTEAELAYDAALVKGFHVMSEVDSAIWSYHQPPWKPDTRTSVKVPLLELRLNELLPVPGVGVPYNDILEFKLKRKDQLDQMRHAIDQLIEEVQRAPDALRAEDRVVSAVNSALKELRQVADETFVTRVLHSLKVSVKLPLLIGGAMAGGEILPSMITFPFAAGVGAAVGAVAAVISAEAVLGDRRNGLPDKTLAFNYAIDAEQEFAR